MFDGDNESLPSNSFVFFLSLLVAIWIQNDLAYSCSQASKAERETERGEQYFLCLSNCDRSKFSNILIIA